MIGGINAYLFLVNTGATPTATPTPIPAGFEADVAPRQTGDGDVLSTDITQVRRFVSGLDTPSLSPNEFQRTDSAAEVSAVSFGLRYDPALGRAFVLAGDLPEGAVLTVNDTVAGELTVLIDSDRPLGKSLRLVSIGFEKNATDRSIEFDGAASRSDVMGNAVPVEWISKK